MAPTPSDTGHAPGTPAAHQVPPRILIVMKDQWPRANLRAALREVGYDAIGTRTLSGALAFPPHAPGRGAVGAILIDASAMEGPNAQDGSRPDPVAPLLARYGSVPLLLLGSAVRSDPPGAWTRVIRRPFSIQDVVDAVSAVVPLGEEMRRPIDQPIDQR